MNISVICLEAIRDYGAQSAAGHFLPASTQTQANVEKVTVIHELGHQFGLGHSATGTSIMEAGCISPTNEFSETEIKAIRSGSSIQD